MNDEFLKLKQFIGEYQTLTIPRVFAEMLNGDLSLAIILNQILFWCDKGVNKEQYEFAKTYNELSQETGVSVRTIKRKVKKLKNFGLISTKVKKFNGNPTVYYTVHIEKFIELFNKTLFETNGNEKSIVKSSKNEKVKVANGLNDSDKLTLTKVSRCHYQKCQDVTNYIHNNTTEYNVHKSTTEKDICTSTPEKKAKNDTIDYSNFVEKWNTFAKENGLAQVLMLNNKRKSHLKARLSEKTFDFDAILNKIKQSDFLLGKKGDWKVNFDFVISPRYLYILEGKYDNSGGENTKQNINKGVTDNVKNEKKSEWIDEYKQKFNEKNRELGLPPVD